MTFKNRLLLASFIKSNGGKMRSGPIRTLPGIRAGPEGFGKKSIAAAGRNRRIIFVMTPGGTSWARTIFSCTPVAYRSHVLVAYLAHTLHNTIHIYVYRVLLLSSSQYAGPRHSFRYTREPYSLQCRDRYKHEPRYKGRTQGQRATRFKLPS